MTIHVSREAASAGASRAASQDPRQVRAVAVSSFLGNTIEFYDFLLYGTASAIVFSRLFFPGSSELAGTLASFATLAAGYVARPLGGLVFGHFGDRLGRRRVLLVTMTTMGIASGLIGLVPTYDSVGPLAPVLLVMLRVVQGLAVGGEWGGAGLMAAEHASTGRRGFVSSIPQMGLPFGAVLATLAFLAITELPEDDLLSWGWRLPFLASFLLLGIGLYVRLKVEESPIFTERAETGTALPMLPALTLLRTRPVSLVQGVLLGVGSLTIQGIFGVFLISYAARLGYDLTDILLAQVAGAAVGMATIPLWALLSDRIGRKPVFLAGAVSCAILAYPAFALVNSGSVAQLYLAQVLMYGFVITAMSAIMVAFLAELFSTEVRYTGVSFSYQAATTIGGGFAPLAATSLLASNGSGSHSGPVALLVLVAALLSGAVGLTVRDRRSEDLRDDRA